MSERFRSQHLQRKTILYVRQSSAYQVSHNLETQKLVRSTYHIPCLSLIGCCSRGLDEPHPRRNLATFLGISPKTLRLAVEQLEVVAKRPATT